MSKDDTGAPPSGRRDQRHFKRTVAAAMAVLQLLPASAWAQQTIATHFEYDAQGNLTKLIDPNGKVTDLVPDNLDRLQKQTLPAPTTSASRPEVKYTYDGQNRLR